MNLRLCAATAALLASGLATPAPLQCPSPEPGGPYYLVTRADPRACPAPICGGWFVKEVNRPKSRCADGTYAADCHALEVDLAALSLGDKRREALSKAFGEGHALLRGRLERRHTADAFVIDVLVADEGWLGQAASTPTGQFTADHDNGTVCVTTPCPTIDERVLNVPGAGTTTLDAIDLAASGADPDKVAAGREALSKRAGILVAGHLKPRASTGDPTRTRIASEFYLRTGTGTLPPPPDGQACGGPTGISCPADQYCELAPGSCATPGAEGTCHSPPEACPTVVDPVCGCDGVTYGNDCERQGAGVPLDHEGACDTP